MIDLEEEAFVREYAIAIEKCVGCCRRRVKNLIDELARTTLKYNRLKFDFLALYEDSDGKKEIARAIYTLYREKTNL